MVQLSSEGELSCELLTSIDELSDYLPGANCVLIDIPIGLQSRQTRERSCDRMARAVLQQRRSSVFAAPSRCAFNGVNYAEANALNRECTGRGLSRQSFNILPKIREVDRFLGHHFQREIIHEMHPEVCFWALNRQQAMQFPKRSEQGFKERVALLNGYLEGSQDLINQVMQHYLRRQVARDDIVDALVGALTASKASQLQRFPDPVEFDELGLPMEVVYWLP